MEGCPGHLVHLVNSATKRCPSSAVISSSWNSNSPSSVYITPPVAAVSSPVSSSPDSVAIHHFSSRPHHLFKVFLKVRHRKIWQCSTNKDGGCRFEYTAYTRNFENSLHLTRTLAARCPNAKLVHKNSLCSWEKLFFTCCLVCISMTRAFRCQYALENKVGIRTSDAWRWHTVPPVYRLLTPQGSLCKAGIPTSDATGKFVQSRYTGFQRPKG